MKAQIQALTSTVATHSTAIANAAKANGGGDSSGGGGGGSGGGGGGSGGGDGSDGGHGGGGGEHMFKFTQNMGAYCYMCGHHPIGANHTSVTCTKKREGHNNLATADHRFGGCNF